MPQVLLAPDTFKGTLTAAQVASHLTAGLNRAAPGLTVVPAPVADGGDGTVDALVTGGGFRRIEMGVRGPDGHPVTAAFAVRDKTAVIEAAQACGLTRFGPGSGPLPLTATSRGAGELIAAALRRHATVIVLGLGGTGTTDGGAGLLTALGARLLDAHGRPLPPGGAALTRLDRMDLSRVPDLSCVELIVASDVDNPLLGPAGAAAVYAPQKGATPDEVTALERGLSRWADLAEQSTGKRFRDEPGAGAAGGIGFAALAFLGATIRSGIDLILDLLGFRDKLPGTQLVITGEGALDEQTLRGKAVAGVARATAATVPGIPVVAVCGSCALSRDQIASARLAGAYPLTAIEPDLDRCRADPGPLLERLAAQIAADWLPRGDPQPAS